MEKSEEHIEGNNVKIITDQCLHKPEVLTIGDQLECLTIKEPFNFNQSFEQRLQQLLLGRPSAPKRETKQYIGIKLIQVNPQTRHYEFCIQEHVETYETMLILDGPYSLWLRTINADLILRNIKEKLKHENWISENVLEKKAQEKDFWKYENRIYRAYSHANGKQEKRILNFVIYLHEQYRNERGL